MNFSQCGLSLHGSREHEEKAITFGRVTKDTFRPHENSSAEREPDRLEDHVIGKLVPERGSQQLPGNMIGLGPLFSNVPPDSSRMRIIDKKLGQCGDRDSLEARQEFLQLPLLPRVDESEAKGLTGNLKFTIE